MSNDHVLRLTSFDAGINIYTGTVQGGHTYAAIVAPDGARHDLERVVDQAYVDQLRALDPEETTYRVGDTTERLTSTAEALALARQWMSDNAPQGQLVDEQHHLTDGESGTVLDPL